MLAFLISENPPSLKNPPYSPPHIGENLQPSSDSASVHHHRRPFLHFFERCVPAIVTLKDESTQCKTRNVEPILEEFIPLKKNCEENEKSEVEEENDTKDKMNWMSSVRLWNTDDYKNIDSEYDQKQDSVEQFIQV
ncbi:hypothetical protein U1Q18_001464 [Sarracenia purpurea var. burkii]